MNGRVGASPRRVGGHERVTGEQAYVADLDIPDVLHARLVTVDCARARIISIDTTAAMGVPGVRLVMTPADLPDPMPRFGPQFVDRPVLAIGETHYHGEAVAAVAADTKDAAEEAVRLVKVEYEELPAVFTVDAALDPGAPLVQDPSLRPNDPFSATNVLREHRVGWGDLDAAVADLVVEHTYQFPMVTQFAIEPHAYIAAPEGDGISVWSTIQHPNWLQKVLARILGLPLSKVRILSPDPGGAFGGKQHAKYEPLVAFMALRAGRPVRLVLTLEETFQAVRRASASIRVRTGFRTDGTLAFQDIAADYLIGAYADIADRVVGKGSYPGCGPYRVPAARILARSILSPYHPVDRVPRVRRAAGQLGGRVEPRRGRHRPRDRSARAPPPQPRAPRRVVHPVRHAGRRRLGAVGPPGGRDDRLGNAPAARSRPRHRRRHQVRPDDRPLLLDGPTPRRRQHRRLRRHVGHGSGSADDPRPDRGGRARGAARVGHGRDGRHRRRAV